MASVDAVIAALKVALKEAETSLHWYWEAEKVNRWVRLLPGTRFGSLRNLILNSNYRTDFIGHVRATIAFLETNRDAISAMKPWSWSFKARAPEQPGGDRPIDAEFEDITPNRTKKVTKGVRLIK